MSLLFYILEMSGRIGAIHSAGTYSPYTIYLVACVARQCDDVDSLANETMNEILSWKFVLNIFAMKYLVSNFLCKTLIVNSFRKSNTPHN